MRISGRGIRKSAPWRAPLKWTSAIVVFGLLASGPAGAGEYQMGGILPGGGGAMTVTVPSMQELKFAGLISQQEDFSCGAAAVATVLRYAYDRPVTEKEVLAAMLKLADPEKVRQLGFSMLDMKRYLETIGLRGNGYRLAGMEMLEKLKVPVIVLLNLGGYSHFVVVRKATPKFVFVADPALGMRAMDTKEFEKDWPDKIILLVVGTDYQNVNSLAEVKPLPGAGVLLNGDLPNVTQITVNQMMRFTVAPSGMF